MALIQRIITVDGSSTTASSSPLNWADKFHNQTGRPVTVWHNYAVAGSVLSDLRSRMAALNANFVSGSINIALLQIGANDLVPLQLTIAHGSSVSQWADDAADFLGDLLALNAWRIGLCTLNPRDPTGFNANRNIANPLLRAFQGSLCEFILDFAAHPIYGVDAAAFDTNYYADGTHPTNLVQQSMADTTQAIVDPLLLRSFACNFV